MGSKQQLDKSKASICCPLDQLKHIKRVNFNDFESWTSETKIVSEEAVNGIKFYRVRFVFTHPIFDQLMKESDFKDVTLIQQYHNNPLPKVGSVQVIDLTSD